MEMIPWESKRQVPSSLYFFKTTLLWTRLYWSQTILLYQSRKLAVALIYTQYESICSFGLGGLMTVNDRGGRGGGGVGGGLRLEGRLQLPGLPFRQAGIQIVLNFLRKI